MKTLAFALLSLTLLAQEAEKKEPQKQSAPAGKTPEKPKPPTIEELQKQIADLTAKNEMANKLLQEYHQRWSNCDVQLTQELVNKKPGK